MMSIKTNLFTKGTHIATDNLSPSSGNRPDELHPEHQECAGRRSVISTQETSQQWKQRANQNVPTGLHSNSTTTYSTFIQKIWANYQPIYTIYKTTNYSYIHA